MPARDIPLSRTLTATAVALAPSAAALALLVALEHLDAGPAVIGFLGIALLTILLVRRYLAALARFRHFVEALSDGRSPELPRLAFAPAATELAAAAATLSQRWQAEARAREALTGSAQAVLDGLPDPLLGIDGARRISRVNRAALELLGPVPTERDLALALRTPVVLAAVDALLAGGDTDRKTLGFALSGPPERDMLAHLRRLPRPAADGTQVLVVLHDTTALVRAERMRADFVANASHELKTPIAAIGGFVETLRGPARDDAKARERFLAIVAEQAERMRRLVDDLLTLSRIEQHEHDRPAGRVDLAATIANLRDVLQIKAAARGIAIAVHDAPPAAVPGDPDELAIVFQNLLDNALNHAPEGSEIEVSFTAPKDGEVAVAVRDRGDGIEAHHLPRLTERFYRADPARSRVRGGTGLGLAIVKHVLTRHRGRLEIKSAPGQGSTFTAVLPTG